MPEDPSAFGQRGILVLHSLTVHSVPVHSVPSLTVHSMETPYHSGVLVKVHTAGKRWPANQPKEKLHWVEHLSLSAFIPPVAAAVLTWSRLAQTA